MKKCSVIIDGMVNLDLKIPFSKNTIDKFDLSMVDLTNLKIPDSFECYLRFLGIKEEIIENSNRFYFEAFDQLNKNKFISCGRCNLVRIEHNKLVDFTSGLSEKKAQLILDKLPSQFDNLIVTRGYRSTIYFKEKIDDYGILPHQSHGVDIDKAMKKVSEPLRQIMEKSLDYFKEKGLPYCLWPYKVKSCKNILPLKNENVAFIGAVDALIGSSKAMGFTVLCASDFTGNVDTNLNKKLIYTIKALNEFEYVILHLNGADEAAHRGDEGLKQTYLKDVENKILIKLMNYCKKNKIELELVVDHICDSISKKHHIGPVPRMNLKKGVLK